MNVFVTGAVGYLGSTCIRMLTQQGFIVKGLIRPQEREHPVLKELDMTAVEGDMLNVAGFAGELNGCDVLIHTVAYFHEYFTNPGEHWNNFLKINVEGTINLLKAAEKQGIQKVVYVSAAGCVGKKANGDAGDESTPFDPDVAEKDLYFKSKILAEDAVGDFLKTHALPVTSILPGWIKGPFDALPSGNGQFVLDFLNGKVPFCLPGGIGVVDVRDVAQAIINAIDQGESGQRYLVTGPKAYVSMRELLDTLETVSGQPAPKVQPPFWLLMAVAWCAERYAAMTGTPLTVSRASIRTMKFKMAWNSAKAQKELGIKFRSLEETLRDEIDWYKTNGYIG